MNINKVGNFSANWAKKAVTQLGKPGALLPVVLLEVTVDSGRAYQAKKRGGITEMRERMIDDISAGVVWLFGAVMFNKLGDKIGKKFFKIDNPVFSTGKDKARDCLAQGYAANPKNSHKLLSAFKFSKVVLSIATAVGIIGWVLPKVNQAITRKILGKKPHNDPHHNPHNKPETKQEKTVSQNQQNAKLIFEDFENYKKSKKSSNPSFGFKLSPETLGKLAHNFEHNATYRLAATDGGILVGRTTNARTFDEGLEYGFRDAVSSYFYLLATGHVIGLLNKFDRFKGKNSGIDPTSAVYVNNHLADVLKDKKLSVEEFEKTVFGTFDEKKFKLIENKLKENGGNISVKDFIKLTKAKGKLAQKAWLMSNLQPTINGVAILTDKQAADVLTSGSITDPKFLFETINQYFTDASVFGKKKVSQNIPVLKNKTNFISITDIESMQKKIVDYVQSVVEMAKMQAKKSGSKAEVTMDILKKASKRNTWTHSSYLITGIGISALFLSTLIPKMQYWITKKRTGKEGFPGVPECQKGSK